MENKVEEIINYLTNKVGLTVTQIAEEIGMPRTRMYYRMKSMGDKHHEDLAKKLLEKYSEHFPGGEVPLEPKHESQLSIQLRYIESLETSLRDARAERDRYRDENEKLIKELKELIRKKNE